MQYGNFEAVSFFDAHTQSLNRTMQYGNLLVLFATAYFVSFKSYYVVWKPENKYIFGGSCYGLNRTMQYGNLTQVFLLPMLFLWFKSYYVVWKPYCRSDSSRTISPFKSYYVVWKQLELGRVSQKMHCLNRTMQYGNCLKNPAPYVGFFCLNRTMQYGNNKMLGIFKRKSVGLNRTMQYGNLYPFIIFCCAFLFKSYYVVWKQTQSPSFYEFPFFRLNRTMQYGNQLSVYANKTYR